MTLPLREELTRMERLEGLADRCFALGLALMDCEPTKDGLASVSVEARNVATELSALRNDA